MHLHARMEYYLFTPTQLLTIYYFIIYYLRDVLLRAVRNRCTLSSSHVLLYDDGYLKSRTHLRSCTRVPSS